MFTSLGLQHTRWWKVLQGHRRRNLQCLGHQTECCFRRLKYLHYPVCLWYLHAIDWISEKSSWYNSTFRRVIGLGLEAIELAEIIEVIVLLLAWAAFFMGSKTPRIRHPLAILSILVIPTLVLSTIFFGFANSDVCSTGGWRSSQLALLTLIQTVYEWKRRAMTL